MRAAGRRPRWLVPGTAVLVVFLLHNDTWNRAPHRGAILGLPHDVAYHVAWIGLATLALWLVLRATWPRAR